MPDTHISTIIREYATVAAVAVGGGWALWRWGFEEWLRRQRDFPAVDGEIRTFETKLSDRNVIVTVNALWSNRGKLPVELDTTKTFVNVYSVGHSLPLGPFDPQSTKLAYSAKPLARLSGYVLEPGTDSIMQQCLVL